MVRKLIKFPFKKLVETIVMTLLNKYDCFITIEGISGSGKSTLAIHLARGVRKVFKKLKELDEETVQYYYTKVKEGKGESIEEFCIYLMELDNKDAYHFRFNSDLIYSQKEMLRFLSSWNRIGIPDEMINVTFNRDFYSEAQKDIIKMINMYRDHCNLFIACVPQFQTLDNQIKNLCKIRLSVVRRGIAIMQTPNKTIYGRDKWDQQVNEKIEREWLSKGIKNPSYARLTTCRGMIRFPKLPKQVEALYQNVKNKKRGSILKDKNLISDGKDEDKTTFEKTIEMLLAGKIRNSQVIE
jgi:hypothetical protein